ncbi:MAG: TlpA family protein disulfide reductase [Bacteroidales bacterium]|nr:TlpA family protein disulfide reductase [Bacteroidales bacterium]
MKRALAIILALAAIAACQGSKKTVVNGKILGYNGEYTEFFIPNGQGGFDEYPAEVAEDGTFTLELDMAEDWLDAPFFVDKFMFRTCIEKGKTYNAVFDCTVPEREDEFHFEGEGAAENEFCRYYFNHFFGAWQVLEEIGTPADFNSYTAVIAQNADKCRSLLSATGNQKVIDYYTPLIDNNLKEYSYYYPFIALARDGKAVEDKDYAAFAAANDPDALSDEDKQKIFNGVAAYVCGIDGLDIVQAVKQAGSTFSSMGDNNFFMTSLLRNYLSMGNTAGAKEAYSFYSAVCKDPAYIEQVSDLYEATVTLAPGSEAPQIEMEDPSGKKVMLSDLRGKALYIDFWATWCGPCQGEIPHMAKLAAKYAGNKKIAFVSISLDEDKEAWKKQLEDEKPAWAQYILTEKGQEDVAQRYKISAIPRFVMLDKDGRIIALNADRPSSAGVTELIENTIK